MFDGNDFFFRCDENCNMLLQCFTCFILLFLNVYFRFITAKSCQAYKFDRPWQKNKISYLDL